MLHESRQYLQYLKKNFHAKPQSVVLSTGYCINFYVQCKSTLLSTFLVQNLLREYKQFVLLL